MNSLSGGCLTRYCRAKFWAAPCCVSILRSPGSRPTINKQNTNTKDNITLNSKCVRISSSLIPWIQVRYKDDKADYPRLHSDITQPNYDYYRKSQTKNIQKTTWGAGDDKPGATYVISFFGLVASTYAVKSLLTFFISSMSATADVLAMASIEVDLSKVALGACLSYKWRGKPLFIKHRTEEEIQEEAKTPLSSLRDPQTPEQRTLKPEWLIVIGICTHLGCVPIPNTGDFVGGFYCPCHGSHYDNIGRARKGPAPLNLEKPPYKFLSDTTVLVG